LGLKTTPLKGPIRAVDREAEYLKLNAVVLRNNRDDAVEARMAAKNLLESPRAEADRRELQKAVDEAELAIKEIDALLEAQIDKRNAARRALGK